MKVPEDQRVVSLRVHETGPMAAVRVENPFEGELTFADGLPKTSKGDTTSHGFGSLSMRLLTERYDGLMDISTASGRYILSIVLPLPE